MMLQCLVASKKGYKHVLIRTVDKDVAPIAVAVFENFDVEKLWIAFGLGDKSRSHLLWRHLWICWMKQKDGIIGLDLKLEA